MKPSKIPHSDRKGCLENISLHMRNINLVVEVLRSLKRNKLSFIGAETYRSSTIKSQKTEYGQENSSVATQDKKYGEIWQIPS